MADALEEPVPRMVIFFDWDNKGASGPQPTTRIIPLHTGKGRSFGTAISAIIDYVENPDKTDNGQLITRFTCESCCADAEFALAKRQYVQKTGRVRGKDDVIAYQVRQSFVQARSLQRKRTALVWNLQNASPRKITPL